MLHVIAGDAVLDRAAQMATLHTAHVASGDGQAAGDTVVLHLAKNGNVDTVNADGHAMVGGAGGVVANAPHLVAHVNDAGKLQSAAMDGGMRFEGDGSSGSAQSALLHFNAAGAPVQMDLLHAVHVDSIGSNGGQDTLTADRVIAHLLQDGRRTALRDAVATGSATLRSIGPESTKGR